MQVLESNLDPHSESFQRNAEFQRALTQELRTRLALVRQGGGAKAQARHAEQGKLFARTRIDRLLDDGSPFLELSPLAAWEMYGEEGGKDAGDAGCTQRRHRHRHRPRPQAASPVLIANDATVKGGAYFPMTVKKDLRAQATGCAGAPSLPLSGRFGWGISPAPIRSFPRQR